MGLITRIHEEIVIIMYLGNIQSFPDSGASCLLEWCVSRICLHMHDMPISLHAYGATMKIIPVCDCRQDGILQSDYILFPFPISHQKIRHWSCNRLYSGKMGLPLGCGLQNQGCLLQFLKHCCRRVLYIKKHWQQNQNLKSFFLWVGSPLLEMTWLSEIGLLKGLCSVLC